MAPRKKPAPDKALLFDQYRICVEEYRFQTELNWKRSQYYFVLNAALLVAGVGLLNSETKVPSGVVATLFFIGTAVAFLAILATYTQIAYYHASRDQMKRVADELELGEFALKTTPGLGAQVKRAGRVTTFHYFILGMIGLADLAGAVVALTN